MQEKSGSVGAAWPPRHDAHNRRVKGFCPKPLGSREDARAMFREIHQAESAAPGATRTTVRAFVKSGLVEGLRTAEDGLRVEASFDAGNVLPGHMLVYFGRNAPSRLPPADVLAREMGSVREMASVSRTDMGSAAERVARAGYSISRLNGDGLSELPGLLRLYSEAYEEYTFQLTPQTISSMLMNGNLVIVGRAMEAGLASALIAEHVELALEGGKIAHLYELSDYATFRAHRGRGLITLMQMEAIRSIRALPHGQEAVIYAEDRAAWMAVNKSSQRAGMEYCGTLLQHCVIVSDRDFGEVGRYENLNVWAHIPAR